MNDTIDVLELLTSQHTEVDELIEHLEAGKGHRAEQFAELADKLAAHATVEEKIFYPSALTEKTSDQLHEAVEEHFAVKRILADMMELELDEDDDEVEAEFDAKLAVLKEMVAHHAHEEEEGKLFPILRTQWDNDERAAIGSEVLAMFETLIEGEPRRNVPAETAEPAHLPSL